MRLESRIFFCEFRQSFTHFALTCFGLRLDCEFDYGLRELHGFQNNRVLFITNSISGRCDFESNCRSNITGIYFIQFCSLIRMHLQNTSDTFFFVFGRIQYIGTGIHRTGINSEKCQFPDKRICHDFKCQCRKRFLIRRMSLHLIAIQIGSFDRRNICRRRHKFQNRIQKLLNALVPICGTTAYGNRPAFTGSEPQCFLHVFYGRFFPFQIHHC